jgi:hypothetical protein
MVACSPLANFVMRLRPLLRVARTLVRASAGLHQRRPSARAGALYTNAQKGARLKGVAVSGRVVVVVEEEIYHRMNVGRLAKIPTALFWTRTNVFSAPRCTIPLVLIQISPLVLPKWGALGRARPLRPAKIPSVCRAQRAASTLVTGCSVLTRHCLLPLVPLFDRATHTSLVPRQTVGCETK